MADVAATSTDKRSVTLLATYNTRSVHAVTHRAQQNLRHFTAIRPCFLQFAVDNMDDNVSRSNITTILNSLLAIARARNTCYVAFQQIAANGTEPRLAKCRHDTLIQSKRKQQIAIFLQFTSRYASHLRYFSYDLAIFLSFSPFSFYETARLLKNSSFFKIGAFIIAFKRNINSRIYPTEKCREKDGVIRHIDALIWPTLSKRFAFALYQPWLAKCRHDTLIQRKRKQQIAIFLQLYVTIRVTSALFFIRSRHFPYMKLRDCSKILVFLKLAHLLLHLNAISTRLFFLQKSAGKKMVLFAILMHSFGQP